MLSPDHSMIAVFLTPCDISCAQPFHDESSTLQQILISHDLNRCLWRTNTLTIKFERSSHMSFQRMFQNEFTSDLIRDSQNRRRSIRLQRIFRVTQRNDPLSNPCHCICRYVLWTDAAVTNHRVSSTIAAYGPKILQSKTTTSCR